MTGKKISKGFLFNTLPRVFSTTGRVSSQGQGSQDSPSNIVAGKLKYEIMLLMSLRQLASHYLLSEKLEKHMEPVLPSRQFCLLMNLYE